MKINVAFNEKSKEELLEIIESQSRQIDTLSEMLRLYRYRQFGNKSEKFAEGQLSLFDEADLPKNTDLLVKTDEEIH